MAQDNAHDTADFMLNYPKYYAKAFMTFVKPDDDPAQKNVEQNEIDKKQGEINQKEADMKFIASLPVLGDQSNGPKSKAVPADQSNGPNRYPFCFVVDFKSTYNGQPSIMCPNCHEVDADNTLLGYCADDVQYTCECYPQFNTLHTPQTDEGFPPPEPEGTELENIPNATLKRLKQFAVLPLIDGLPNLQNKKKEKFHQIQIDIMEKALVRMSELKDDGAFKVNMMPRYNTCMKFILPDSPEIPEATHQKYIRRDKKNSEDKDDLEDEDDLEDNYMINIDDKDDSIHGYRLFKMGIVEIMEFAIEEEIIDFITDSLEIRFGLQLRPVPGYSSEGLQLHDPISTAEYGCKEIIHINAAEENILFLPVFLRTFRPQIEANFSPKVLAEFDRLLTIIEEFWWFDSVANRHGYVKYIFDIAKFFGFEFYDRVNNADKLDFDTGRILYRGVCLCCKDLVYSFMADD